MDWKLEKRALDQIKPYTNNPRVLTKKGLEDLKKSMDKFGLAEPIVVNTDGTIIGGHARYEVAKQSGLSEVDVYLPDKELTEQEYKELNIRLNKNIAGEWDFDILGNEFNIDDLLDWGFSESELDVNSKIKEDEVPEVEGEPQAKLGDIYQLGNHRLMCGDSINPEDVGKLMQGDRAQMCFTDPPYNVDYTGGMGTHEKNGRSGILNDKMSKEDFYQFLLEVNKRIIENTDGGIYVCMSSSELDTLKTSFEEAGGHWQSFIIWVKDNFTLSRSDYQHLYEPILYGWNGKTVNHHFIESRDNPNVWESLDKIKTEFDGKYTIIRFHGFEVKIEGKVTGAVKRKKQKNDIWRYDKPTKSEEHPTMKPVKLCAEAVKNSSKSGEIVLDLFGGSGSTLIACEQLNRKCYMMELDPKYVDVIIKRYELFTGDKATKEEVRL